MEILRPGRNCWRVARAEHAALLIDGAAYFAAFREAARHARRSILIAGWDVDSRVDLAPQGADDGLPRRLGEFLDALVAERRDLHVYVLTWDFAVMYALERELLPVYTFGWRTHERLHYHLDDRHPPGGPHHQKIAVVDNWQAEVLTYNTLAMDESQRLLASVGGLTATADSAVREMVTLSAKLTQERTAALRDLFARIERERRATLEQMAAIIQKERAAILVETSAAISS